jgi:uncharacterized protein YyaL (SSP411 family)
MFSGKSRKSPATALAATASRLHAAAMNAENHLAGEKSPYLLQHVRNAVDWYPWGEAAFEKARQEDKPIFLSIGYSTCHWCHVMAHESFDDPETADLLNRDFVSVKVDREERPDVDRIYMTFIQATIGAGGWPMSVWLTPDLKPFVGGTYFPPEDHYGRPGFKTVLERISEAWKSNRNAIDEQGEKVIQSLRNYTALPPAGTFLNSETAKQAFRQILRTYDPEYGGFSDAPKFPRPVILNFLLRYTEDDRARQMTLHTLREMAKGGIHDHLGGGFHRYSVDRYWHIPHFEKMLYDQAQLAISYLEAFQITKDAVYSETARDILDYVLRYMTSPDGGFYSAEDADSLLDSGSSEHGEGAYYIWKSSEIDELLGTETARVFNAIYGVDPDGNAPSGSDPHGEFTGRNTLIRKMSDLEAAEKFSLDRKQLERLVAYSRLTLLQAREHRPRPHLDDKIITAWNGLMISAFSRAAQILGEYRYLESAEASAAFLREHLFDARTQTLRRSFRNGPAAIAGFAEDYSFLIQGLLDLYEADFEITNLEWADILQKTQNRLFAASEGGFYATAGNDPTILLRMKEYYDGAEPSPNSIAALNLMRLAAMTGNSYYREQAENTINTFSAQLSRVPSAMPQMLIAMDWSLRPPAQFVIAGDRNDPSLAALLRAIHSEFRPGKVLLKAGEPWLIEHNPHLRDIGTADGKSAVYRCENFMCSLPVTDPEALKQSRLPAQ